MKATTKCCEPRSPNTALVLLVAAFSLLASAIGCSSGDEPAAAAAGQAGSSGEAIERVVDGDTVTLASGIVIRLVQIDAPEVRRSECYSEEATATLAELLPAGTNVRIEPDPALDQRDRYGRALAYVVKDGQNVNKMLVERGAASVWFYGGARGRYADDLLAAAQDAQAAGRGLWGACEAALDPSRAVGTRPPAETLIPTPPLSPPASSGAEAACHPSYDPCLPVVDDLNCSAVRELGKAPVRVLGSDPYRLDGDRDGTGCV